jgi:LysM repeat protein
VSGQVRSSAGRATDIRQLLGGVAITLVSVGMLLGSFLLSQLDTLGVRPPPTQVVAALSPSPATFPPATTPAPLPTMSPSALPSATETTVPATSAPSASPALSLPLMPSCPRPPGWFSYSVRQGETLAGLAWRVGITTFALMRANCLSTPTIYPGQQIYLPPSFYASPTPQPYRCGPPLGWAVYIVRPRDTLYSLSLRFRVGIDAIRRANCLDGYVIYVGQALYLPPLSPTPIPTPTSSRTPTPPYMPTLTQIPVPTLTPSLTPTYFPTAPSSPTPTYYPTRTVTPMVTSTATHTPAYTPTPTGTPGSTLTPTFAPTSTPTQLPTSTPMPTPIPTEPPTYAPMPTPTPTGPPTFTPMPSPTLTPFE